LTFEVAPSLPSGANVTLAIAIDVYQSNNGTRVTSHSRPLEITIAIGTTEQVYRFLDPTRIAFIHVGATGQVTRLRSRLDCVASTLTGQITATSSVGIAVLTGGSAIPFRVLIPSAQRATTLGP
jgi:hypothetical protein